MAGELKDIEGGHGQPVLLSSNERQPLYLESVPSAHLDSYTGSHKEQGLSSSPSVSRKWRPSKGAMLLTAAGLLLVAGLAFGLIFGLPGGDGDSSTSTLTGTGECEDLATGLKFESTKPFSL